MQTLWQFMRSHPIGGTLPKNDWGNNDFLGITAKIYKPHSLICRQGDDNDGIFIVKSGWAILYQGLLDGERQIIDTPLWGDIVGFRSVDGPHLASLAERLSIAGLSAHGRYECPLTQYELADILGMTTVHVNRTLRELRNADLVSFKAGHVEVINRKKLVKIAGFDNDYLR